jgi:REP element-mobilizing transposase RayT
MEQKHDRKSIRLKGYDYTSVGRYLVTVVVGNRWQLFGKIVNGEMVLNEFGEIAANDWKHTLHLRDNVSLEAFMIMLDHVKFLIHINKQQKQKDYCPKEMEKRAGAVTPQHINKPGSLVAIVRSYKGAVTRKVLS